MVLLDFIVCIIWCKDYYYGFSASESTILAKCITLSPMPDDVISS